AVKLSGWDNHLEEGSSVKGLSISITSDLATSLIAREEYSVGTPANKAYRPRLIIGAASRRAALPLPAVFKN
ncbi:MAG TPA: hypothetical protein VE842_15040, partial [Pyrinomonadaceae bacterium]|nr:hypothetical protein [Pyrinomonadaceae bacterium]